MSFALSPEEKIKIATDITAMTRALNGGTITSVMKRCTPQGVAMAFALAAIGALKKGAGSRDDFMNLVTAAWDISSGGTVPPRTD